MRALGVLAILSIVSPCVANDDPPADSLPAAIQTVMRVGHVGDGHEAGMKAWGVLSRAGVQQLPLLLRGIDDTKPLGANWLRAAVDQVAERGLAAGHGLPTEELERLILSDELSPRARRLAYEWLARVDASAEQRIVPQMLNDSSLEMRRDAVTQLMDGASATEDKTTAVSQFKLALSAARDLDQIDAIVEKLSGLDEPVDLPTHFGFVTNWKLIGPFDNTDKGGFDVPYTPEKLDRQDFDATYTGKTGPVKWLDFQTNDKYGMVDLNLNTAVGKNMGAASYAWTSFVSPGEREVDVRLGCINANKVWLNGELLLTNEVYHAGTAIDQYVARGKLKRGENQLLLKICQNEQTENWAQDWQFQLRICDELGTAILSAK